MSGKQQGQPTPGVRLIEMSVKRELTAVSLNVEQVVYLPVSSSALHTSCKKEPILSQDSLTDLY